MIRLALLGLSLAAACGGPRRAEFPVPLPPPPPVAVVEVENPNFELIATEAVPNAEDEGVSFTKIFVDGKEAGKTSVGPRSQEKHARLKLAVGNQLVRLEHWLLPPVGEWTILPEPQQPRERFVRIRDGEISRLTLRFAPDGAATLTVTHEALSVR